MSRKVAFTGIFTGITVVLIYMGSLMPTGRLTIFFLAALPVALSIIEFGAGAGIAVYFAACLLSVLTAGSIHGIIPFAMFFGHYPIWKYYIEKGRHPAVELLLKLAVFNVSLLLWYLFFEGLFMNILPVSQENGILIFGFIAALQLAFFMYDYVLSRILYYYEAKLSTIIRK